MLTTAQKATLKTNILSITGADLPAEMYAAGNLAGIADYYNVTASPDFFVWGTAQPVQAILDAITWANLTPVDAPDTTQVWANRALAAQGKQFNIQLLLPSGQPTVNGAKPNIRAGLQDALTNLPTGTNGAILAGNWPGVRTALARKATWLEKVFADTSGGQNGSTAQLSATMVVEGTLSYTELIGL